MWILACGTVGQLFTLAGLLTASWEFFHAVHMSFVDLEKVYNRLPPGVLWVTLLYCEPFGHVEFPTSK